MYDVIIIGGGPAGISAALILGRSCRKVLVIDAGKPRNRFATHMQGFTTRDGIDPVEFLEIARSELSRYDVAWLEDEAAGVEPLNGSFRIRCGGGSVHECRKVLITTGVKDRLPAVDRIEEFYGKSVHHCPYCHGWEVSGQTIGVYGTGESGVSLSLSMKSWSDDVVLFTDGNRRSPSRYRNVLEANGIRVEAAKINGLEGTEGNLEAVMLEDGRSIACTAMFFSTGHDPHCRIPEQLGCRITQSGEARVNRKQETNIEGVYMAGDAAWDMHLVIVAAAEGAKAGVAINTQLQEEERIQPHPEASRPRTTRS